MEGISVRTELEVHAERFVAAYMLHQGDVGEKLKTALKKAYDELDIDVEVQRALKEHCRIIINEAVHNSLRNAGLKDLISAEIDSLVEKMYKPG